MAGVDLSDLQAQLESAFVKGDVPLGLAAEEADAQAQKRDLIDREKPDPPLERKELVQKWNERIKRAKKYWEPCFEQMRKDQDFVLGLQWSRESKDDRYVANLTLRIVAQ